MPKPDSHTPQEILVDIHKLKYRYAIYPLTLILLSLVIFFFFRVEEVRYLTLIGFFCYLIIISVFRINKNIDVEDDNLNSIYSPISGKISAVKRDKNNTIIYIKKNVFCLSDIRVAGVGDYLSYYPENIILKNDRLNYHWELKGSQIFIFKLAYQFKQPFDISKFIIGLAPLKIRCCLTFPPGFVVTVQEKQKIVGGLTQLGYFDHEK